MFTCHVILPKLKPDTCMKDLNIVDNGKNPQIAVKTKNKGGKTINYDADCICVCEGTSGSALQSYYLKNLSPMIQKACESSSTEQESSALLMTIGKKGSGKSSLLYGEDGNFEAGMLHFICQDVLEACSGDERRQIILTLIRSDAGNSNGKVAYDCLAQEDTSALLSSADDATSATEIEIKTMEDAERAMRIGSSEGKKAHTLLTMTIRHDGIKSKHTKCIKLLDLHGDMPPTRTSGTSKTGKGGTKVGRGGRGGRKGGRGWSSYDTRKGSASSNEDPTIRAVRRVIDFLARRFQNVPYDDSLFTSLLQIDFERSALPIVALICLDDEGSEDDLEKWNEHALDFMTKLRKIIGRSTLCNV